MNKRMTSLLIMILGGLLLFPGNLAASDHPLPERLKQSVEARIQAGEYPAVVIAFVRGDQAGVYTFGALKDSEAPDADTVFEIGSVTKTFTGLLLADAIVDRQVTAETPVTDLLPGITLSSRDGKVITLGNLATQHSGLPRLPANLAPADVRNPYADYDARQLEAFFDGFTPARAPGARYEYSNLGYGLLGYALARRADTTYAKLMADRVLAPLAMEGTGVNLKDGQAERLAPGHDQDGKDAGNWDFDVLAGAGALKSSGADMLRYLKANMGVTETALLPAMQMAHKPKAGVGGGNQIGFGWMTHTANNGKVIWHNGMTGGYASFIGFTDDGERGVVILTNIARSVDDLGFAALLPEAGPAPASKAVTLSREALKEYVGHYRLAPGVIFHVTLQGGQLLAQLTGQEAYPVFASDKDEFFYNVVDAQLSFRRNDQGEVNALILHQNGVDQGAPKIDGH